jgi:hypothetical protein
MNSKIFQIQIVLNGFKPKIWRRILITSDLSLSNFHKIIQTTMGWTNSHLHQFIKNRTFYTTKMKDDFSWNEMDNVDYKGMKVSDLLQNEKEKIIYEYDFGDGWNHNIILEKILPIDNKTKYPVCLDGKMNCPPEDCGGIWRYAEMVKTLKNPKHKEYESIIEWLGEDFDPEYFDKNNVNELLKRKNYGCF